MATLREKARQLIDQIDNARAAGSVTNRMLAAVLNYLFGDKDLFAEVDNKANKDDVYTKTETDTKINKKADKATTLAGYGITDAYSKTETDTKLNKKADKATTLAGYGITDAYTKSETDTKLNKKADKATTLDGYGITDAYSKVETDTKLSAKAGTDVYQVVAKVDQDRQAAPFSKIVKEQINLQENSAATSEVSHIHFSEEYGTFVYYIASVKNSNPAYYTDWLTKKHYVDADGKPYLGKVYFSTQDNKGYYFDGTTLLPVEGNMVLSFGDVTDLELNVTLSSYAGVVNTNCILYSEQLQRFVYDDTAQSNKIYDNWETRALYNDPATNKARTNQLYFAAQTQLMYYCEDDNDFDVINKDIMSGYVKSSDHALTGFIQAGEEDTVIDPDNIFAAHNAEYLSNMRWHYFILLGNFVVGEMRIETSFGGSSEKIRIKQTVETRAALATDKKTIQWNNYSTWTSAHSYYRFVYNFSNTSSGFTAKEWGLWTDTPALTSAEKKKIANTYTKTEVDALINNFESSNSADTDDIDTVPGKTLIVTTQRTSSGGTIKLHTSPAGITTVFLKKAEGYIKIALDGSTVSRGIPTDAGCYKMEFYSDSGTSFFFWTKLIDF